MDWLEEQPLSKLLRLQDKANNINQNISRKLNQVK